MSFMCWSFVFLALVSCLSPAKLLKLSGFVLISPHSFCFFPVYAPHFFLFSKRGNSTHNTHNIYNFVENQALDSQQTHNKTPTRSQHLTTSPQSTRKCCELLWVVVAFFVKITPPLTFSSSVALAGFVVNVVSVVSRICILPKNAICFYLLEVLVFVLSKALFLPPQSPVSHPPIPLSSSQSPLPSSPFSSKSRFRPLPSSSSSQPKRTAERHEAVPPFLVGMVCSKMEHCLFLSVYEGLPNNPLNKIDYSQHSTT